MPTKRSRRLPQPPVDCPPMHGQNGYTNGHNSNAYLHKGLPPEPRPYSLQNNSAVSQAADIPVISMPTPELNGNDWNMPRTSFGSVNGISRHSSDRATAQHESYYGEIPPRSPSSLEDMYAPSTDYVSTPVQSAYRPQDQTLRAQPTTPVASASALYPGPPRSFSFMYQLLVFDRLLL